MKMKKFSLKEAKKVGDKLRVSWKDFDARQFRDGMNVELEHGTVHKETNITNDNPIMTGKIALAHLNEFHDYYYRLEKLEKEAKKYWRQKKKP